VQDAGPHTCILPNPGLTCTLPGLNACMPADVASQAPANQPAEDGRTDMRSWTTKRCKLWIANAVLPERRQAAMTLVDALYIGCDQFGTPGAWLAGLLKEDLVKLLRSVDDAAFVYRKIQEAQ